MIMLLYFLVAAHRIIKVSTSAWGSHRTLSRRHARRRSLCHVCINDKPMPLEKCTVALFIHVSIESRVQCRRRLRERSCLTLIC